MAPIPDRGDKRAFFDININGEPAGRIVFALWNFKCPKTVENFRTFCTGELGKLYGYDATYQGSIFHRVIKGFMIQGGDITKKNGSGGFSIYGSTFDCENLALKHSKPYLLSMANRGPDTNGSQFFITTEELPHLDGKHCVFGEVIKGFDIVKRIEELETGENDVPTEKVQVVNCGEMVRKGDQDGQGNTNQQPSGVKMDDEPRTFNWLMRRSRSPSPRPGEKKKKSKRDQSNERNRRNSRERFGRGGRRSRSRSNDRNRRDDRRGGDRRVGDRRDGNKRDERKGDGEKRDRPVVSVDGVKVRGRGKLTFLGGRTRSRTPPHWKKEESKKETLEQHQKKLEEEEERKKRTAQRERLERQEESRLERERRERETQRELERQKEEAQRELDRQEGTSRKRSRRSSSSESESEAGDRSPYELPDLDDDNKRKPRKSSSRSRSASRSSSSSRSTPKSDSD